MIRRVSILLALSMTACGGGSVSAGASVSSDGTVHADVSAEANVPGGTVSADYTATGVAGGHVDTTAYARPTQGYATTGGCVEEWVHMPMIINFPSGGAIVDAQSRLVLQEMVRSAQSRTDIVAVRTEGHTDHCGREVNNIALSQQRAEAIAMELVQMGVPRDRVQMIGYGSSQPRANEDCSRRGTDDLSRNMNRRVEFSLLVCR